MGHLITDSVEHLVIGGGPAGSMLAMRLAAAGREVLLLEKEREPHHKVCGEFLSREAIEYLQRVAIEPGALGAHAIHRVRLHSGRRVAEAPLPFTALSLSRRVLDEALLEGATSSGCKVLRGAFVENLLSFDDGWTAQLRGGRSIRAKTVFLATGKHDLKDWERGKGSQRDLVGFKMHWKLRREQTGALDGSMELFLFRDGYGGLALVEDETANLCFVVRRRRLRELGRWTDLLDTIRREVPGVDQRFHAAAACWTKPLAISPIPYGHLGAPADGVWRIGDQAAVIPSFTGDGMSIALHSAELAAEMYLEGKSPDEYSQCLGAHLRPGMKFASALSRMMVTSLGRRIAPLAVALKPDAMGWIVTRTRIPNRALRNTQSESKAPAEHLPAPIT